MGPACCQVPNAGAELPIGAVGSDQWYLTTLQQDRAPDTPDLGVTLPAHVLQAHSNYKKCHVPTLEENLQNAKNSSTNDRKPSDTMGSQHAQPVIVLNPSNDTPKSSGTRKKFCFSRDVRLSPSKAQENFTEAYKKSGTSRPDIIKDYGGLPQVSIEPSQFRVESALKVDDRYDTLETIGVGSFGEVKRIRKRGTNEIKALKVLPKSKCKDAAMVLEEIQILQHLVRKRTMSW
jgi:hypothetical protein